MFNHFLERSKDLYNKQEPFAMAFVVSRQEPSSGKPGDKAIIEKSGKLTGWIGGGCTRGIVLKEASNAISDGQPRLVRISPDGESRTEVGVKEYKMTCHSGGSVEIYIEPVLPRPQILIFGKSHVAMALAKIAKAMDYTVNVISEGADTIAFPNVDGLMDKADLQELINPHTCVVVCTQGENDEQALEQALGSGAPYISFVASRRKGSAVFYNLRQRGINFDQLKKIKTPAGLDINAKLPEEVAISILAEIIQYTRTEKPEPTSSAEATSSGENNNVFINPVCGIPVEKSTAKHVIEYQGENYYFCCDGCKVSFEKEPEKYAMAVQ
jgi:xanthine dehydrogenase accessory factor